MEEEQSSSALYVNQINKWTSDSVEKNKILLMYLRKFITKKSKSDKNGVGAWELNKEKVYSSLISISSYTYIHIHTETLTHYFFHHLQY